MKPAAIRPRRTTGETWQFLMVVSMLSIQRRGVKSSAQRKGCRRLPVSAVAFKRPLGPFGKRNIRPVGFIVRSRLKMIPECLRPRGFPALETLVFPLEQGGHSSGNQQCQGDSQDM